MTIAAALASIARAEVELRTARLAFPGKGEDAIRAIIEVELQALAASRRHLSAADIVGNGFGDHRLPARFWAKVQPTAGGCWEFTGATNDNGYPYFRDGDRVRRAHCLSYERLVGPIPDGFEVDHMCENRICIRPSHLEPLTSDEHAARGAARRALRKANRHDPAVLLS